jgi:hypothetical protein
MQDLGDGWKGRKTAQTRVALHDDGSSVVYQDGALIAQAAGVTTSVLAYLFGDLLEAKAAEEAKGETND